MLPQDACCRPVQWHGGWWRLTCGCSACAWRHGPQLQDWGARCVSCKPECSSVCLAKVSQPPGEHSRCQMSQSCRPAMQPHRQSFMAPPVCLLQRCPAAWLNCRPCWCHVQCCLTGCNWPRSVPRSWQLPIGWWRGGMGSAWRHMLSRAGRGSQRTALPPGRLGRYYAGTRIGAPLVRGA